MKEPIRSSTMAPIRTEPRTVYIHVPFCRHRCGYCNFTLVAGRDYLIDRFLRAIETEIGGLDRVYEIDTLFYGGGTPSHLSPADLKRLDQIVRSRFSFDEQCEVTAECNPSDLTKSCAHSLASCGINRISLGVQSLNTDKLKLLERDHNADIVKTAIDNARRFTRSVSIDMIFATPHETFEQWRADLSQAIELRPDHFSTYELTFEKGTSFWKHREWSAADDDLQCQMYEFAIDELASHGYEQYEISSFAKSGHACIHNNIYWSGLPYFAFGPGASRFIDGVRETNHQSTSRYINLIESGNSPIAQSEKLSEKESAIEQLVFGLRRTNGIMRSEFARRTGFEVLDLVGEGLRAQLCRQDLIQIYDDQIKLTRSGLLVCDWIAGELLGQKRGGHEVSRKTPGSIP